MNEALDLLEYGVCVTRVMDESSRAASEQTMWSTLDEFPEYKVKGRGVKRSLGGFGALGNPSSFHHAEIRKFRRFRKDVAFMPIMREYAKVRFPDEYEGVNCEALFDRIIVRCEEFGRPTAETWHRDVYGANEYKLRPLPKSLPGDEQDIIFGGWLNMSPLTQTFVCNVCTHKDVVTSEGFAQLSDAEKREAEWRLTVQAKNTSGARTLVFDDKGRVVIPPGHAVIFEQQLVHSVVSGPQPAIPQMRFAHGIRLTCETSSLFNDIDVVTTQGCVPRIPSGQVPPMYSKNHYSFFNKAGDTKFSTWGSTTFVDACLFKRVRKDGGTYHTPGSRGDTNKTANKGRFMPSLLEMGLWTSDEFAYTASDVQTLCPEALF